MTAYNMKQSIALPPWFQQWLPLVGLFVRDQIEKANAPLRQRIEELENRISQFRYCGVWVDGARYERGNFVTHNGSVWHCDVDTDAKPGTNNVVWTLAVKHGKDFTDPPHRRLPTRGCARPQTVEQRR